MHSCLYVGRLHHRRFRPVVHAFRYSIGMIYLDLDELPELLQSRLPLYSSPFSPGSFCRGDYLGDPTTPLADAVRDLVEAQTGHRPEGPVRLLAQLRRFGYYFSPLNLYYCFDVRGSVEAVMAEVSNTPWRERHCYVLWDGNRVGQGNSMRFCHRKGFHVSPFMDMDFDYRWYLNEPGETAKVCLANYKNQEREFVASMVLDRRPLDCRHIVRSWFRYPWMPAQVIVAIYYQALRLWMKKCPFQPHPKHPAPRL